MATTPSTSSTGRADAAGSQMMGGLSSRSTGGGDPVVRSVIRVFTLLQVVTFGATAVAFLGHSSEHHPTAAVWAMLALCSALLGLSLVPAFWRSSLSLPVGLAILFVAPTAGQALALLQGAAAFEKLALEQALFLVVPLLIVAWQYSFRVVVALALLTGAVDITFALLAGIDHERGEVYLHVLVSRTAGLLLTGYVVSRLVGELRAQHRTLAHAHARLTLHADNVERLTVSRERNRVARELHDTLAHTLSAMTVQLEAVRALWGTEPDEARSMVDRCSAIARGGLAEVRRALHALRASPLDDLGMVLAIRHLGETFRERTGIELQLHASGESPLLSPAVEQGIFRIAQEALENIERHAGASLVQLDMVGGERGWTLTIKDNGCGFDPGCVPDDRYGLRGIRERAELLGAELALVTGPGQGTVLTLLVSQTAAALTEGQRA